MRNFTQYTTYLIDLYGVIHNGKNPFPGALTSLKKLVATQKKVILFSNSPRTIDYVKQKLEAMSIDLNGMNIMTSGEHYLYAITNHESYGMPFLKGKAFIIKNHHDNTLLSVDNLKDKICDKLQDADYIVIAGYTENKDELHLFDAVMQEAVKIGLPAICPNPDLIAYQGDHVVYTGGTFSKFYEQMGGVVHYFGKPSPSFYELALNKYVGQDYNKSDILAIGDNLDTDILGAKNFGIDSLLITKTGICKRYSEIELMQMIQDKKLNPMMIDEFII